MNILNKVMELAMMYWSDLLLVAVVVLGLLVLWKKGKKDMVRKLILDGVVRAEKTLGSGTGQLKLNMVLAGLYQRAPLLIRVLFTEKEILVMIEDCVKHLKYALSDGTDLTGAEFEMENKG